MYFLNFKIPYHNPSVRRNLYMLGFEGVSLGGDCFLGSHMQHMEVPRLGVESELQLPAYATATATWDLSHVCNLHHSL